MAKPSKSQAKNFKASLENKAMKPEGREAKSKERGETKGQERAETHPPRVRRKQ